MLAKKDNGQKKSESKKENEKGDIEYLKNEPLRQNDWLGWTCGSRYAMSEGVWDEGTDAEVV